jgi:hypothetical protein
LLHQTGKKRATRSGAKPSAVSPFFSRVTAAIRRYTSASGSRAQDVLAFIENQISDRSEQSARAIATAEARPLGSTGRAPASDLET